MSPRSLALVAALALALSGPALSQTGSGGLDFGGLSTGSGGVRTQGSGTGSGSGSGTGTGTGSGGPRLDSLLGDWQFTSKSCTQKRQILEGALAGIDGLDTTGRKRILEHFATYCSSNTAVFHEMHAAVNRELTRRMPVVRTGTGGSGSTSGTGSGVEPRLVSEPGPGRRPLSGAALVEALPTMFSCSQKLRYVQDAVPFLASRDLEARQRLLEHFATFCSSDSTQFLGLNRTVLDHFSKLLEEELAAAGIADPRPPEGNTGSGTGSGSGSGSGTGTGTGTGIGISRPPLRVLPMAALVRSLPQNLSCTRKAEYAKDTLAFVDDVDLPARKSLLEHFGTFCSSSSSTFFEVLDQVHAGMSAAVHQRRYLEAARTPRRAGSGTGGPAPDRSAPVRFLAVANVTEVIPFGFSCSNKVKAITSSLPFADLRSARDAEGLMSPIQFGCTGSAQRELQAAIHAQFQVLGISTGTGSGSGNGTSGTGGTGTGSGAPQRGTGSGS